MMSYTAAARLREICITQGEAEASAVGRRAESKDEPAEPQSGRAQTAPFLDAGGTQELLSLAQEQVTQGVQDVLGPRDHRTVTAHGNLVGALATLWEDKWDGIVPWPGFAARMARLCGHACALEHAGDYDAAGRARAFLSQAFHSCHWPHAAWRGANLGGWLLVEPGPASPLFDTVKNIIGTEVISSDMSGCEWDLCVALDTYDSRTRGAQDAGGSTKARVFDKHRATHYTTSTMRAIRAAGLNAVRIPFGYWIVSGATHGDVFHGPALDILDTAVASASAAGLQVVLDLHGCPGGENAVRPCGRVNKDWCWQHWRMDESLEVLRTVALRYKHMKDVTGLQVCNEPSPCIPAGVLCSYYERAVAVVREAGMLASDVAIILPVFTQWRIPELGAEWKRRGNVGRFDNVAFDVHWYHDFNAAWALLSHAQHVRVVEESARSLCLLEGAVVGEWSLARPAAFSEAEVCDFARRQVQAYNHATHGWFFWNWHDHQFYDKWDMEKGVFGRERLPSPLGALSGQVLRADWQRDPWLVPRSADMLGGAGALVHWVGRLIADPLVGFYDGGLRSWWRRFAH